MLTPDEKNVAGDKVRQVVSYLKGFAELSTPMARRLSDHIWSITLNTLPAHECIVVRQVLLEDAGLVEEAVEDSGAVISIKRPNLTSAPQPPEFLISWLDGNWAEPSNSVTVRKQIQKEATQSRSDNERFDDDEERVLAYNDWQDRWNRWAEKEVSARKVMEVFERLYNLHIKIRLEGEQVELMLGDGVLQWNDVDHPILLQRVELVYDETVPEIRLFDADRLPELYTSVLNAAQDLSPDSVQTFREELEVRRYHPLEHRDTSIFLTRVAHKLAARGEFVETPDRVQPNGSPLIVRDPVLFLRRRQGRFVDAFDRLLGILNSGTFDLPVAVQRLVGIGETSNLPIPNEKASPWCEPQDVLLSKAANEEQIAIVRALERHHAVQVQGPPGTGKTHTIANLIGHFAAQGKSILVTSHTSRALRVLREHIVETVRPLAVAVLDSDLESRNQLQKGVETILSRLSENREDLNDRIQRLAQERKALNDKIAEVTVQLEEARKAEYSPIILAGIPSDPAEAARWVRDHSEEHTWIPGPLTSGAPLPLSPEDITQLYASNALLSKEEEAEMDQNIPSPDLLPAGEQFAEWTKLLQNSEQPNDTYFWETEPKEEQLSDLRNVSDALGLALADIERLEVWQKNLAQVGYSGGTEERAWCDLVQMRHEAYSIWERSKATLIKFGVVQDEETPLEKRLEIYAQAEKYLKLNEGFGTWARLIHRDWWPVINRSRVDDSKPKTREHFTALMVAATLEAKRAELLKLWARQAEPVGLPKVSVDYDSLERKLFDLAKSIRVALGWWKERWPRLEQAFNSVGLRWARLRGEAIAKDPLADPYTRDVGLILSRIPELIHNRLLSCEGLRAARLLDELAGKLSPYHGPVVSDLQQAVRARDADAYRVALIKFESLVAKATSFFTRKQLLAKLEVDAPAWSEALRQRAGLHAQATAPGSIFDAWKWRQYQQELERRSELDERSLVRQLEQFKKNLRDTTAELIECKAWSAEMDRIDLPARQALTGWSDTIKKIGKGTGIRAPALQAKARELLKDARRAVPIWIMSLPQVAESFEATGEMFDVVIVDEASQSDVLGLLAWFLGKRILVVGDDEQVNPLAVGQGQEGVSALISQHLDGIPNSHLYDGKLSIYDLAGQCFGGTIRLREHFRCVPSIIDFSSRLSYNGEIRPMRSASTAPLPHVIEYVVQASPTRVRVNNTNEAEARTVVALLKAMIDHPLYERKTFGAISLLADSQAQLIQHLAVRELGATEIEKRRFIAGNAAQFQGDERDVMVLSMVDVPESHPLRLREDAATKQRYNVAVSRARDQLWLVHSLDPNRDLKEGDLRRRLIAHARDHEQIIREVERQQLRAESEFEKAVIKYLVEAGYRVETQKSVGNYRIDLIVGSRRQVAVECDGDRYHGFEQIPQDMARQAILERAGWDFVRIRGTQFYRDPQGTMAWVFSELNRYGVNQESGNAVSSSDDGSELRDEIVRNAWIYMNQKEWVSADSTGVPERVLKKTGSAFLLENAEADQTQAITEAQNESDDDTSYDAASFGRHMFQDAEVLTSRELPTWKAKPENKRSPFVSTDNGSATTQGALTDTWSTPRVAQELLVIIDREGPVLAQRAYAIYLRERGIQRMGSELKRRMNKALQYALSEGLLLNEDEGTYGGLVATIVRLPESPPVVVRQRGERTFDEIPLSELQLVARKISKQKDLEIGSEEHQRAVLEFYELKRLTNNVCNTLKKAMSVQFKYVEEILGLEN